MLSFIKIVYYKLRQVYCPICGLPKKKPSEEMCIDCHIKEVNSVYNGQ